MKKKQLLAYREKSHCAIYRYTIGDRSANYDHNFTQVKLKNKIPIGRYEMYLNKYDVICDHAARFTPTLYPYRSTPNYPQLVSCYKLDYLLRAILSSTS